MSSQQVVNALALGGTYALLAEGLTLTWGVLAILNFAHVQYIAWGGLLAVWLSDRTNSALSGVVLAVLIVGIAGALIDRVPFSLVRRRGGGEYGALVMGLGAAAIFGAVGEIVTHSDIQAFPQGLAPTGVITLGSVTLPVAHLVIFGAAVVAFAGLGALLRFTRVGRDTRSVASDAYAAEISGVHTEAVYTFAQGLAAALGGLAGALVAVATVSASSTSGVTLLLKGFAATVIGGTGSAVGAAIGGLVLGFLEVATVQYGGGSYRDAIVFGLLILVLLAAPRGLMGVVSSLRARTGRPRTAGAIAADSHGATLQ